MCGFTDKSMPCFIISGKNITVVREINIINNQFGHHDFNEMYKILTEMTVYVCL